MNTLNKMFQDKKETQVTETEKINESITVEVDVLKKKHQCDVRIMNV